MTRPERDRRDPLVGPHGEKIIPSPIVRQRCPGLLRWRAEHRPAMDPERQPVLTGFDVARAAIIANMIEAYLAGAPPPSEPEEPPMTTKITDHHLSRGLHLPAPIDPGPSALQPGEHGAPISVELQGPRAGVASERIRVLDRDLGQSSSTTRDDFKTLVNDVAMGQVGAVFALEASRLARSSQQWHRLLELCAITRTIVIDEDGAYDPADFNDSLVLGLKGTFAQAELTSSARLRRQAQQGGQGELHFPLPVGLVFEDDKIVLDPDQEIQGAVRAVFELFEQEGSAYRVVRRFHDLGLRFPRRAYGGAWDGRVIWGRLTHGQVLGILANPCYAGTYVFGRHQAHRAVGADGEIYTRRSRCRRSGR